MRGSVGVGSSAWTCVGETQGRGKLGDHRPSQVPIKTVWVYPLRKGFRGQLSHWTWSVNPWSLSVCSYASCAPAEDAPRTAAGSESMPRLAGQHKHYLVQQMEAFKDRKRTNDNAIMFSIQEMLTEMERHALALYLSGLTDREETVSR